MNVNLEKPKVSVILPTYNSEKTILKCLKSIDRQSYPYLETIIVDNFSHDDTVNIAKGFGAVIMQRKCNPAVARNVGVAASVGHYILFLDSDQILSENVIKECVEKTAANDTGMVKIPEVFIGKGFWSQCSAIWKNTYGKVEQAHWRKRNILCGIPRFYQKEQLVQAGMFNPRLHWGEDYDLYERMSRMGIKEAMCKAELYHLEPSSIGKILWKLFIYGKSLQDFRQESGRHFFSLLLNHSLLTLAMVTRDYKKSPSILIGCTILLFLKTYYLTLGLIGSTLYLNRRSE